jgi:GNAT superfamily N-acetyltransferase
VSVSPPPTPRLRTARPSEVDLLGAIDDDAGALYAQFGLAFDLASDHPFVLAEQQRWQRSAALGRAFLAIDATDTPVGFAALDMIDGEPYLDQLSVRVASMRQGIGARLLARCAAWARDEAGTALWLTTYGHLPFNRPYYERHGYQVMPEAACGPGIRRRLAEERRHLPAPQWRVVMRRLLDLEP